MKSFQRVAYRRLFVVLIVSLVAAAATLLALAATQIDLLGPVGSEVFGRRVVVLTNGNIVVTDPYYDAPGPITDTGAVYLYNGATGALISRVTGSTVDDHVGKLSVIGLGNGNFVFFSPDWDNGTLVDAGAVTWGNGLTGITGTISSANSLVGSSPNEMFLGEIRPLKNGNYLVLNPGWDNGTATGAGAVTWGNGATGITGTISLANSLVGDIVGEAVGYYGIVELSNGNYVVPSRWNIGELWDVNAVTWGNGTTGITGVVSVSNSLVGNAAYDLTGLSVTALSNGNYVVSSPMWDNGMLVDAGAVTWGNGTTGITGVVSATNSLVGSTANDRIGSGGIVALSNGNYVVVSSLWDNGVVADVGAATWGNGATAIIGVVSVTNSLVGSAAYDDVSSGGVTALSNGNYVVVSPRWDNGVVADVGAATWGNGTTGITGVVSMANSLVGSTMSDLFDNGDYGYQAVTALSNGNYVVSGPLWDNGAVVNVGTVTWGNGTTGSKGVISSTNSLIGGTTNDGVGHRVIALSNGNYVVDSPGWDNGALANVGAATWGNGTTGIIGVVSTTNSLVGSTAGDMFTGYAVGLNNGHYVVINPQWDNGALINAGAVTRGNGTAGITGVISITNSLVGSTANDGVGYFAVTALDNGNYVVESPSWDDGPVIDAGAVTLGDGRGGTVGPVTADNSVRGLAADGGWDLNFDYDYTHNQLVVGRPADNIVTLLGGFGYQVYLPLVLK